MLCQDFDNLSLDDGPSTDDGPSSEDGTPEPNSLSILRNKITGMFNKTSVVSAQNTLNSSLRPDWALPLIKAVGAPFIDIPSEYIDGSSLPEGASALARGLKMCFGFRFLPGQSSFILRELELPQCFEKFSFLSNSLGLFYGPSQSDLAIEYSRYGLGLLGDNVDLNKVLIEVITHTSEHGFGRFLVLVCLGVGCTVWYGQENTHDVRATGLFAQVDGSYESFFSMDHIPSFYPFKKLTFLETHDISAIVESTFANEPPFAQIPIASSGPVVKAVGLGVMIALFLATGVMPSLPTSLIRTRE